MKSERWRRLIWRIGRKLYCRARNEVAANNIAINGESYVQACVLKWVKTSTKRPLTVIDVGANLGEWTRQLLEQLPEEYVNESSIFLFEPVASTKEKLARNLEGMANSHIAKVFPLAMSDEIGEAEMVVLSEAGGTNTLEFDARMAADAIDRTSINKTTLDRFCIAENIEHIHLLKSDAEGHDAYALSGARELLQSGRIDVAQFEYNHRWIYARSYLKDVFDLIDGLPYRLGRVCPSHIEMYESWHFELERFFEGNYVIIHKNALDWFEVHQGKFDISNSWVRDTEAS